MKHEMMLKTIKRLLESNSTQVSFGKGEEIKKVLKKHMEIEQRMLREFEKMVDDIDDRSIRFLVQNIISDEKRHHSIFQRLLSLIFESEDIRDEKWWDFLYRVSLLKG
jgi:rubrerythrin